MQFSPDATKVSRDRAFVRPVEPHPRLRGILLLESRLSGTVTEWVGPVQRVLRLSFLVIA